MIVATIAPRFARPRSSTIPSDATTTRPIASRLVAACSKTTRSAVGGIRTLSSQSWAYDPLSYQRGSVWPVDNALIALGLKRSGLWQATNRVAEGNFTASRYFSNATLPELWAGLERQTSTWPLLRDPGRAPLGSVEPAGLGLAGFFRLDRPDYVCWNLRRARGHR